MSMNREKHTEDINRMFRSFLEEDVSNVELNGIEIRSGNRIIKFKVSVVEDVSSVANDVKNELKQKFQERLIQMRDVANEKLTEIFEISERLKNDFLEKERDYQNALNSKNIMPEITYDHARKGLSVVKGRRNQHYTWLFRGVYWPKYYGDRVIDPRFVKKMMTPIIIVVETQGDNVVGVSTRKTVGLDYFSHYHQNNPDCWGNWKWKPTYKTPDDIILTCMEAMIVLEKINPNSIAKRSPEGLPNESTIRNHLLPSEIKIPEIKISKSDKRAGISDTITSDTDIWSV